MSTAEEIYRRLPAPLQNLACSCIGWRVKRQRYDRTFQRILQDVKLRGNWSSEQIACFRDRRLAEFIQHAVCSVPYYADLFRREGLRPGDIKSMGDLQFLPVLSKEIVKSEGMSRFLSTKIPHRERTWVHTSGTTGSGFQFAATRDALREQWAIWWRYRALHGVPFDAWCAYFGGRSIVPISQSAAPFWRFNYPGKQLMLSAYHLSPRTCVSYIQQLNERQPPWFHGYPSFLSALATLMLENELQLEFAPKWITTGAENLNAHQERVIREAFGVPPIQHYGMAEAIANISQMPDGRHRVDEDFAVVEFLESADSRQFRIVGTNLSNLAMPLIRYEVGDLATINMQDDSPEGWRYVDAIDGREEDYIILKNGARLGRLDHIFKDAIEVREAQIRQSIPGEITIFLVVSRRFGQEHRQELLSQIRQRVGDLCDVSIEFKDRIEKTKSGKLRFVISECSGSLANDGLPEKCSK